jgi:DNA replication protein DnaC
MMNEPTLEKLRQMRIDGMADAWAEQHKDAKIGALGFDDRFGLLVDAESLHRENRRLRRLLREAKLKLPSACIEDVDYAAQRHLDKAAIRQLANCRWVQQAQTIAITGATGTGKTYLACALANHACRKGFSAMYRRSSRFFDELAHAHADGSYPRLLIRIARVDVLVLDDWGMSPLRDAERRDMLEILDDRSGTRATVMTSQIPPSKWHDVVGDPTTADAICDRLLHNAHRIELKGPSRRKGKKDDNND